MPEIDDDQLTFVIAPPRSGSTLLARMLGSHPVIHAPPEPQLVPALFQLGYYGHVKDSGLRDGAMAYHPGVVARSAETLVRGLPRGEADYIDALKLFLTTLYGRLLAKSGKRMLVDKSPRNSLYVDFIVRLFPKTRFVILTRDPLAVAWSIRHQLGHVDEQLVVEMAAFTRAVGTCIRERPVECCHVRYERLVANAEQEMARVCDFLKVPYDAKMLDYGANSEAWEGVGDTIVVNKHSRPTDEHVDKWARDVMADPAKGTALAKALRACREEDIASWGYSFAELEAKLERAVREGRQT